MISWYPAKYIILLAMWLWFYYYIKDSIQSDSTKFFWSNTPFALYKIWVVEAQLKPRNKSTGWDIKHSWLRVNLSILVFSALCLEVIPVSLFVCRTLLYLRLRRVLFSTSFEESSVSLPHLKILRLELNVYSIETSLESLISYCPVLEDLAIDRTVDDNVKYLRVRTQTLTSLGIKLYLTIQGW